MWRRLAAGVWAQIKFRSNKQMKVAGPSELSAEHSLRPLQLENGIDQAHRMEFHRTRARSLCSESSTAGVCCTQPGARGKAPHAGQTRASFFLAEPLGPKRVDGTGNAARRRWELGARWVHPGRAPVAFAPRAATTSTREEFLK